MRNSRYLRIIVVLLVLSVFPLAFSQSETVGQRPDGTDEQVILTPEEAFEMTAEWYSAYFGVSMDEARRALVLQQDAGELSAALVEQEGDTVVEVRIEHLPEFHVVVLVAPGGEDRVLPYAEGGPLEDLVIVETVPWTQEQLEADLETASTMAMEVGIPVSSGTHDGRAFLYTPDAEELKRRLKDAGFELPESIVIEEAPLPEEAANYLAGFALSPDCTSGFIGYKQGSGQKGVFTAGHCTGGLGMGSVQFTHAPGATLAFDIDYNSGSRDWQFNRNTTTNSLRSMVNIGTTWLPVTGTKTRSSQTLGSLVCKMGKITGYDCGLIYENDYDWDGPTGPMFTNTWMRVRKPGVQLIKVGDSGGPWFGVEGNPATVRAYGITKGFLSNDGIYGAIDYIYNAGYGIFINCQPDWYC